MLTKKTLSHLLISLAAALLLLTPPRADAARDVKGRFASPTGKRGPTRLDRASAKVGRKLYRMHQKDSSVTTLTENGITAKLYNLTHAGGLFMPAPKPKATAKPYISIYTETSRGRGMNRSFKVENVRLSDKAGNGHPFALKGGRVVLEASYKQKDGVSTDYNNKGKRRSVPNMDKSTWENRGTTITIPAKLTAQGRNNAGQFQSPRPVERRNWDALGRDK